MNITELEASELLLDLGVSIPLRPLRIFNRGKPRRIVIRRPYFGTLIRISRIFLRMDIDIEKVKEFSLEETMAFYSKHAKGLSQMVAYGITRGYWTGKLFNSVVGAYLRWRVHPIVLTELWIQMLSMLSLENFQNIIRSTRAINMMTPRLSREKRKGS